MSDQKPSVVAVLSGVAVGVAVFVGVNVTTGRAIVPTAQSVAGPVISAPKYVTTAESGAGFAELAAHLLKRS